MIAIDPGDFPTDRYVVEGIAAADGLEVRPGFDELDDVAVVRAVDGRLPHGRDRRHRRRDGAQRPTPARS